jgi:hypothetical protein
MDESTTTCPFCREEIKVGAIKCKHCGERLDGATTSPIVAAPPTAVPIPPSSAPAPAAASVQPIAPQLAPVTPKPFSVAVGVALVVLAAWLLFSWIPGKKPLSEAEAVAFLAAGGSPSEWRLAPGIYPWAYVIAALVGLAGITRVVHGLTYRKPLPKPR